MRHPAGVHLPPDRATVQPYDAAVNQHRGVYTFSLVVDLEAREWILAAKVH
jgi:hypothetical protein